MPNFFLPTLLTALLSISLSIQAAPNPKVVILKLDDLTYQKALTASHQAFAGWDEMLAFVDSLGIKVGLGIISQSLDSASADHIQWHKKNLANGHELWHHGLDHQKVGTTMEFCDHPIAFQKQHLQDGMDIVKKKLGVTMQSFGAPYNCSDSVFTKVFEAQSDLKVFMYPHSSPPPKNAFVLKQVVAMEKATGQPDWATFDSNYSAHPNEEVYCLQGHPGGWSKGSVPLEQFKKIVLFLKKEGVTFMTPYGYYTYKTAITSLQRPTNQNTSKHADVSLFLTSQFPGFTTGFQVPRLFNATGQIVPIRP